MTHHMNVEWVPGWLVRRYKREPRFDVGERPRLGKDADEIAREQTCRNFERKAHDSYRERRAEQLGSEAEAFLRTGTRR